MTYNYHRKLGGLAELHDIIFVKRAAVSSDPDWSLHESTQGLQNRVFHVVLKSCPVRTSDSGTGVFWRYRNRSNVIAMLEGWPASSSDSGNGSTLTLLEMF
ncbi:hypothetical protein J6590_094248 [Homalodisca vitripennis]|nr:hypothetical protein J6590_094248 [Homalodisca vitripennis]